MGYPTRITVPIITDASGDADVLSGAQPFGEISDIHYVPDASSPLDTGADLTVTIEAKEGFTIPVVTVANIGTSEFTVSPRAAVHAVADGSALEYTTGEPVVDRISMAEGDRIRVVIAQGGNALSGTFYITVF